QLDAGEDYTLLNPVIALTITDFEMFENLAQMISRFILKEKEFLVDYPIYDLELVFVELPKFSKGLEELETITDKWLYFLKTARKLDTVPDKMGAVPEIKKAFEIANQANLSREELEDLEHREIYIHDQRNAIKRAIRQTKIEIAKQLLDVLDEELISQKTGLSIEEIEQLKEQR
ncbi:MAG TPA: transposase, partial [Cyanobacteria bacterium UBA12227]|nr:transposase [Cyanobacteria bacterium UBA12227]